jgi:subtilisin family serine protease
MKTQWIRRAWPALVAALVAVSALAGVSGSPAVAGAETAGPAPTSSATALPAAPAMPSAAPGEIADGRLLVGLAPGVSEADGRVLARDAGARDVEAVGVETLVVDPPDGDLEAARIDGLRRDARVSYVEPNYRISAALFTPNDPYFPSLTSLRNGQGGIHAESAWNTTLGSRDVVVGMLDSGIDMHHPDLIGNLWTNRVGLGFCAYGTHGFNTVNNTCAPEDDNGHGTHVAGIVGAVGNNGIGVTGVAPRASLMAIKMLDANGNGSILGAVQGIDWAISAKQAGVNLRVLSASWGGDVNSQALRAAVARAGAADILFVTAAGNDGKNMDQDPPVYPCAYTLANVVCVGASQPNDSLAEFSDFGATSVDLVAPGKAIVSTVPEGTPFCASRYCAFDGTSMATPMVSGAAVLVLASDPSLSVSKVRTRILHAVDVVPALAGKVATGGRLNVCRAVPGCGGAVQRRPSVPRQVSVTVGDRRATLRWSPPASNGNGFTITGYTITGPTGARQVGPLTKRLTLTGFANNADAHFYVRARNNIGVSPAAIKVARPLSGGYVVARSGRLSPVRVGPGPLPSATKGGVTFPAAADRARGVALLPDGTGGYVLEQSGLLHPFGVAGHAAPAAATGGPYWPGRDRARGVALLSSGTGGYIVDEFGGLYRFAVGDNPRPPVPTGGPYWDGWDIARGVALTPSGQGGYVVDGYGGIHPFVVAGAPRPPRPSAGPYWPGWDVVRGIGLSRGNGGGWLLDAYGVLHPFRSRGHAPAKPSAGPYWPGIDEARGVGV